MLLIQDLARIAADWTPDRPVVTDGAPALDARALRALASGSAARLRRMGIGPGARVAVFRERSVDMVAALHAIWAAGAAAVLLDPGWDAAMLERRIRAAGAALVTGTSSFPGTLGFAGWIAEAGEMPPNASLPQDVAVLGEAVTLTHGAAVERARRLAERFPVAPDGALDLAAFDFAEDDAFAMAAIVAVLPLAVRIPATPSQRAMIAATLADIDGLHPYWNRVRFGFEAAWRPDRLAAVWQALAAGNDALRLRAEARPGEAALVAPAGAGGALAIEDWTALPPEGRDLRARAGADTPDPRRAPMVALTLRRVAEARIEGVLDSHAAALDARSQRAVIAAFVDAVRTDVRLPRFGDLAAMNSAWGTATDAEFWGAAVAEFPDPPPSLDALEASRADAPGATETWALGREEHAALEAEAQRHGVGMDMLALAAACFVEARMEGRRWAGLHVVLTPDLPAPLPLGGLAIPLPVAVPVDAEEGWAAFLARVKDRVAQTRRHGLADLRLLARRGVVQAQTLRPTLAFTFDGSDAVGVALRREPEVTDVPLEIQLTWSAAQAAVTVKGRGIAAAERAGVIAEQLRAVLRRIAAAPVGTVGDIGRPAPAERRRLLVGLNDTATELPLDETAWSLFAWRAQHEPHEVLAGDETGNLTGGELRVRVRHLADALARVGVRRGGLVAVLVPRGLAFLEAVLAAFALGAAFVPIDPEAPQARSALALEPVDLAAAVVADATDAAWAALAAAAGKSVPVVNLSAPAADAPASGGPAAGSRPSDVAYVLFTSGSTGRPKAVLVDHRGMLNHIYAKILDLGLGPRDLIAQTASVAFDVSVWQFLTGLVCDGRTMIYGPDTARDPLALLAACERDGVTVLEVVPSFLRVMLDSLATIPAASRPGLSRLRWLVVTGEAFPSRLARAWAAFYPRVGMVNAYGPTECSDDVAHHVMPPGSQDFGAGVVPIGRAVANMRLFVLDEAGAPVQPGIAGELYVAGTGVGPGYLGNPEATSRAFPVGVLPEFAGARFYRTGDLVRMRADGVLTFLRRIDDQVKISGHRLELDEIDALIERVPGVVQAVTVLDVQRERKVLGVALRLEAGVAAGRVVEAARAAAACGLPAPLRPRAYAVLPEIPTLPSGKADRGALRGGLFADFPAEAAAAECGVPGTLRRIWCDLLRCEAVADADSFAALGGDSLLVIRLQIALRRSLGVDVDLCGLVQADRFADCVALVERRLGEGSAAVAPDSTHAAP